MKALLYTLLLSFSFIIPASIAGDEHDYFNSKESSRYNTDQLPYQPEHNNRFDKEPIISVKAFDLSSLIDQPQYDIVHSELMAISEESISDNNGRYTIDRLNRLTQQLTQYYRDKGLLLARVYINEQEIHQGIIKVSIIEGIIEQVISTPIEHLNSEPEAEFYYLQTLIRPFRALIGKPSYRPELMASTIQLSRYPGLKTDIRFVAGESLGSTKLDIKIKQQDKLNGFIQFDNYGSDYTGKYRLHFGTSINNISDNADKLSLSLMATIDPTNSYYGSIFYTLPINPYFDDNGTWFWLNPLFNKGLIFDTGFQQTTYSIGQELAALNIKGEATTLFYSLTKPLILNSQYSLATAARLDMKSAVSEQNGNTLAKDVLSVFNLQLNYQFNDYLFDYASNIISLDYHQGLDSTFGSMADGDENSRQGPKSGFSPASFIKYNLRYSRLQQIESLQLLNRFHYQHSDDLLLPIEQLALGGADGVRGYSTTDYNADNAFQATVELIGRSYAEKLSLPVDNLNTAMFLDYGIGWRNDTFANEKDSIHLLALGWYAELVKEEVFQSKIQLAIPLSEAKPDNGNSVQFYLSMQRRF